MLSSGLVVLALAVSAYSYPYSRKVQQDLNEIRTSLQYIESVLNSLEDDVERRPYMIQGLSNELPIINHLDGVTDDDYFKMDTKRDPHGGFAASRGKRGRLLSNSLMNSYLNKLYNYDSVTGWNKRFSPQVFPTLRNKRASTNGLGSNVLDEHILSGENSIVMEPGNGVNEVKRKWTNKIADLSAQDGIGEDRSR